MGQFGAFCFAERGNARNVGGEGSVDGGDELTSGIGERQQLDPPVPGIDLALDQVALLESVGNAGERRRIARQDFGNRAHWQRTLEELAQRDRLRRGEIERTHASVPDGPHPSDHQGQGVVQRRTIGVGPVWHGQSLTYTDNWCKLNIYDSEAIFERGQMSRTDLSVDSPIVARALVRHFGEVKAVDGVDLEVREGEIFGFLGPNGAGKSTVIRMLTTLLRPTSGTATVAGFDVVTQANDVRRRIGVALQDAAIDPLMTGNELLHLQAVLYGLPASQVDARAAELLARVGLIGAADRRVGTYSGGMRRRLDLALSLIHQPSVLFLDEPTTGLDPMSRITLWEEVRRLNGEGTTVLLTTQYLEEADQLADRVAIIDHGKIVKEGTPTDLKAAVGAPTLLISVAAPQALTARDVLARFGELRTTAEGSLGVGLEGGAGAVTDVVRALDEAGVKVQHLELNEPSLDDVFAESTGYRLEGASSTMTDAGGPAPTRKRGRRK